MDELLADCIIYGDFTLRSGGKSTWKIEIERGIDHWGDVLDKLVPTSLLADKHEYLIGIASGGAYLALTEFERWKGIYHNGQLFLEELGSPPTTAVIIDDVCTTGESFKEAIFACQGRGLEVIGLVCVLDRRAEPTELIDGLEVRSLYQFTEVQDAS